MAENESPDTEFWISMDYRPGLNPEQGSWRAFITRDGTITQLVRPWRPSHPSHGTTIAATGALSAAEIVELRTLIDHSCFQSMNLSYAAPVMDLNQANMSIRFRDSMKEVRVYGASFLVAKGNYVIPWFLRVWDYLEDRMPYTWE